MMQQFKTGLSNSRQAGGEVLVTFDTVDGVRTGVIATTVSAASMIRGPNINNYSPTNKALKSEEEPRRNPDTGPTQCWLCQ
ncbi:hypothetical protein TNCV_3123141 [Trichonephila clavipes]|nr:hypothetical protein TNCV_3123141 [Trichonephila clavipes]